MTIDEKLQHFYEVSLDEAREDAAQSHPGRTRHILSRSWRNINNPEHRLPKLQIKAEAEHVRREINKALSAEQITLKRDWSLKQR